MPLARTAALLGCVLLLPLAACGGRAPEESAAAPSGPSVFASGGGVRSVEIHYDGLEADRRERLEAYRAHEILKQDVEERLRAGGRLDPAGDLVVAIDLDSFRLRSSASAFWLGGMAGADQVAVAVRVMRDGGEVKRFRTDTSTLLGGVLYASGSRRTARLMKTLSERIVAGL